jgi:hypothetical protein
MVHRPRFAPKKAQFEAASNFSPLATGVGHGVPVRITDRLDQQCMRLAPLPRGSPRLGGLLVMPSACPSRRIPAVTKGQLRLVEDPP